MEDAPTLFVPRPDATAPDVVEALVARLTTGRQSVELAEVRSERRTYLDTADRRLSAEGLVLEIVATDGASGAPHSKLFAEPKVAAAARRRGAAPPIASCPVADVPAGPADLRPGPLRRRVERVAGNRALLRLADVDVVVRALTVRNADAKAVVRVAVDHLRLGEAEVGTWVRLLGVRGYDRAGERARRAFTEVGLRVAENDPAETALVAGGAPQPATAPVLDPTTPAGTAFVAVLRWLVDTVETTLPGAIDDIDPEFLHDARVAVRRSRSALKHAKGILPAELLACFRPQLKWLQEVTGPTRDLDVHLEEIKEAVAGEHPDLAPLRDLLGRQRVEAHSAMVDAVTSEQARAILDDWRETLDSLAERPPVPGTDAGEWGEWPEGADDPIAAVARRRIHRRYRTVVERGRSIDDASAPEALHDLRKRAKELRYLLELFGSIYAPDRLAPFVKDMKGLQDVLGRFQDGTVQLESLEAAAEVLSAEGAPARVLLAVGQLVDRVTSQQAKARSAFAQRFDRFASDATKGALRRLIRSV